MDEMPEPVETPFSRPQLAGPATPKADPASESLATLTQVAGRALADAGVLDPSPALLEPIALVLARLGAVPSRRSG